MKTIWTTSSYGSESGNKAKRTGSQEAVAAKRIVWLWNCVPCCMNIVFSLVDRPGDNLLQSMANSSSHWRLQAAGALLAFKCLTLPTMRLKLSRSNCTNRGSWREWVRGLVSETERELTAKAASSLRKKAGSKSGLWLCSYCGKFSLDAGKE